MTGKADHVRRARQDRRHTCHWPGCEQQVPPAMWGCLMHWRKIPKVLQRRIWDTYEIGQEQRLDPSAEYIAAAREVQDWITAHYPPVEASTTTVVTP